MKLITITIRATTIANFKVCLFYQGVALSTLCMLISFNHHEDLMSWMMFYVHTTEKIVRGQVVCPNR